MSKSLQEKTFGFLLHSIRHMTVKQTCKALNRQFDYVMFEVDDELQEERIRMRKADVPVSERKNRENEHEEAMELIETLQDHGVIFAGHHESEVEYRLQRVCKEFETLELIFSLNPTRAEVDVDFEDEQRWRNFDCVEKLDDYRHDD